MNKLKKAQSSWRRVFHKYFPYFSDLVEENVKNRCVFPLVILAIYIVLIFIIISTITENDNKPTTVKAKLDLSYNYYYSQKVSDDFPGARVKVLTNSGASSTDAQLNFTFTDLVSDKSIPSFTCDYGDRKLIAGTLHYFRMHQVCKIVKREDNSTTDGVGYATYSQINFERGPIGNYQYQYNATNGTGISDPQNLYINSKVLTLNVLNNSYPPTEQIIGIPFSVQPIVQILDYYGKPLQNKYVIATSWPEPFVPQTGVNSYQNAYFDAQKFAYLSGDVSEPSDANGIAKFKNLTVLGSTYNYTYIILTCESEGKTLWYYPKPTFIEKLGYPFYVKPIKFNTNVFSLKFVRNLTSSIVEGQIFGSDLTPIIQILDSTSKPIAGKLIIALICNYNGKNYPKRYINVRKGYKAKRFLNPFPGNYSEDSKNPLSIVDPIIPILTDSRGYAFFNSSYFSQFGPAGKYKVEFICDGIDVVSEYVNILTSVRKITFLNQPPQFFSSAANNILQDFVPIIRITDADDNPVMGKTPEITLLNSATLTELDTTKELGLRLYSENSFFSYSDSEGLVKLYFAYSFAAEEITFLKIKVALEGYELVSREIKFYYTSEIEGVGYLNLVSVSATKSSFTFGDQVYFEMKAYSNYLIPLFNATVIFDLHAISEDITQIPEEILPLFRINGQTDENGLVKIGNITFDSGISSVYYVRPLVVYSFGVDLSNQNLSTALSNIIDMILDPNLRSSLSLSTYDEFMDGLLSLQDLGLIDFWFGDMISFTLVSQVGSILLLNQTQNSSLRYGLNTTYFFKVRVYSMDSLPLIQTSVNLDFFLIHFPSYLVNDYVSKNSSEFKKTLIDFKQLSAKTDVKGEILFTLLIKPHNYGFYSISFGAQGCVTEPLEIITEFKVADLKITEQPNLNYSLKNTSNNSEIRSVYSRSGDFLPKFQVKITDSSNSTLSNYPIIVKISNVYNNSEAILDFPDLYKDSGELTFMGMMRTYSLSNGLASFYHVATYDIQNRYACLTLKFFCGDLMNFNPAVYNIKMEVSSSETNMFCFYDDSSVQIMNTSHSKKITGDSYFGVPIHAIYSRSYITDMDIFGMNQLSLTPFEISSEKVNSFPNQFTLEDTCFFTSGYESQIYNVSNIPIMRRQFYKIPKSIQGGCDFSIDKYSSIFLNIAKNRAIELNILEYSEVLNSSMIKLINNSRINVTYTKNTQIKIKFSFEKFKWSGSSRKTNFRLAANTYLNLLKNTSLNSEDLIKNMKSLPLAEILPFVKETANVPDGIGLTEAANQISNVIALSDNLLTMIKTNKSLDLIKATSTNFFSNANSVKGTFSNIILSNSKSAITEKIYVASDVDALQIYIQPPKEVTIGYVFQVAVKALKGTSAVVKKALLKATISSAQNIIQTLSGSKIENIIMQLASGKLDTSSIEFLLTSQSNIKLDETKTQKKTNDYGIAYFNLLILRGKNGLYKLSFSASGASPKTSIAFNLVNPISNVTFYQNINQTIETTITENSPITLSIQPILQIKYTDGQTTIKDKIIIVRVYKQSDDEEEVKAIQDLLNSTNSSVMQTYDSLLEDYKSNNSDSSNPVMTIISNMWKIVSNAGKLKSEVSNTYENLEITFTTPNETADSHFVFTDLNVQFSDYGKYQFLFIVDGIESTISDVVEITQIQSKVQQENTYYTITYVILLASALIVLMSNVSMYNLLFNINAGLFLILVIVIIAILQSLYDISEKLMYVICGLLLIVTFEIFLGYWRRKMHKKNNLFSDVKSSVFYEYTYQKMFSKPSKAWINSIENCCAQERKYEPLISYEKIKDISNKLKKENIIGNNNFVELVIPDLEDTKEEKKSKFFCIKKTNEAKGFESKKILQKIKEVLSPFNLYQNEMNIGMCEPVFYPQRLLTALLCSLASTIFMAYQAFSYIIQFEEAYNIYTEKIDNHFSFFNRIYNMNFKVYEYYLEFMNKGFDYVKTSGLNITLNENDFSSLLSVINFVREQFLAISWALGISFFFGAAIASLYLFISYIDVLIDFKIRVIKLRRGEYTFDVECAEGISGVLDYVGMHISNSIIGFLFVMIIFGLTTFPLFWPLFWIAIYNSLIQIIILIVLGIVSTILTNIAMSYIVNDHAVYNRRVFAIFEFFQIYINIAGGIVDGLMRFMIGIIISTVTFGIISEPLLPYWKARSDNSDSVNLSYLSLVYTHHFYNNPIFVTTAKIFINGCEKNKEDFIKSNMNRILEQEETLIKSKSEKMRHFRNKLYIALFLVKNPNLRKYRKNYKSNKEYFEEKNRALTPIEFLEKNKKNSVFKPSEPVISLSEISDEEITNNYHNFEVRQKNPFRNKKLAK